MINNLELREKYNPEGSELRNQQYKMLDELAFLDKICKENGITYFLSGGSVLGAVRHKGFIPWDDDADIALLEKDYNKLIKILLSINDEKYILQCQKTDFNYINGFPKFREKEGCLESAFPPRGTLYKYRGVGVDIFCYTKDSCLTNKISTSLLHILLNKMYKIKDVGLRKYVTKVLYGIYCIIKPFTNIFNTFAQKGELYFAKGQGFPNYMALEKDIFPVKYVQFENLKLPIPNNYENYLTQIYGNWRELPKETQTHCKSLLKD